MIEYKSTDLRILDKISGPLLYDRQKCRTFMPSLTAATWPLTGHWGHSWPRDSDTLMLTFDQCEEINGF